MDSEETQGLVARLKEGDRSVLDPLFHKHNDYIKQVIRTRLGQRLRRRGPTVSTAPRCPASRSGSQTTTFEPSKPT